MHTLPFPILLAVLVALVLPGVARADVTLREGPRQVGAVRLLAASSTPSDVRIVEEVDGQDVPVETTPTATGAVAIVPFTCVEARSFVAIVGEERTAPFTVTTPPCSSRLKVSTLKDIEIGDDLRVTLVDRWHQGGIDAEVCVVTQSANHLCKPAVMPAGGYAIHVVFSAEEIGRWDITATSQYGPVTHSVQVRRRRYARGPKVLFTGDSMMLSPERVLRRLLPPRVRTVDDIYVGSGITRPFVIDWGRLPKRQVRLHQPDATIISLGIGDSRGIGDAACCGEDWTAAYAKRVNAIMSAYVRGGKGAVVWLNVPFSSNPVLWPAEASVNAAIARAATGRTRVRVVDLYSMFTPDGAFHRVLPENGQPTRVRTADGIHLTRAGARIASRVVISRLRALGVIG